MAMPGTNHQVTSNVALLLLGMFSGKCWQQVHLDATGHGMQVCQRIVLHRYHYDTDGRRSPAAQRRFSRQPKQIGFALNCPQTGPIMRAVLPTLALSNF